MGVVRAFSLEDDAGAQQRAAYIRIGADFSLGMVRLQWCDCRKELHPAAGAGDHQRPLAALDFGDADLAPVDQRLAEAHRDSLSRRGVVTVRG